jgi:hypothetical protein
MGHLRIEDPELVFNLISYAAKFSQNFFLSSFCFGRIIESDMQTVLNSNLSITRRRTHTPTISSFTPVLLCGVCSPSINSASFGNPELASSNGVRHTFCAVCTLQGYGCSRLAQCSRSSPKTCMNSSIAGKLIACSGHSDSQALHPTTQLNGAITFVLASSIA